MKLPAAVVRATLRFGVRPVFGPPFPIAFQRWYGDQMARTQRIPSSVTVVDVLLGRRRARRYAGPGARTDAAILWVRGGAFITGSYATHGSFAAHLALAAGLPVYLLDYRLAPDHPASEAVADVVAAGPLVPEGRLVLGGDSAGGCLALLAVGQMHVAGLALVSPMVDLTLSSAQSWTGKDILIRAAWGRMGVAAAFPDGLCEVPDPTVPTVVHVADVERLRGEGEALAGRVGAELVVIEGGWHDVHLQAGVVRLAAEAVDQLGASIASFLPPRR
jgi:monoterpene epsilon-lactone hydrolase